jgi:hypothetical protein
MANWVSSVTDERPGCGESDNLDGFILRTIPSSANLALESSQNQPIWPHGGTP